MAGRVGRRYCKGNGFSKDLRGLVLWRSSRWRRESFSGIFRAKRIASFDNLKTPTRTTEQSVYVVVVVVVETTTPRRRKVLFTQKDHRSIVGEGRRNVRTRTYVGSETDRVFGGKGGFFSFDDKKKPHTYNEKRASERSRKEETDQISERHVASSHLISTVKQWVGVV